MIFQSLFYFLWIAFVVAFSVVVLPVSLQVGVGLYNIAVQGDDDRVVPDLYFGKALALTLTAAVVTVVCARLLAFVVDLQHLATVVHFDIVTLLLKLFLPTSFQRAAIVAVAYVAMAYVIGLILRVIAGPLVALLFPNYA